MVWMLKNGFSRLTCGFLRGRVGVIGVLAIVGAIPEAPLQRPRSGCGDRGGQWTH